MLNLLAIHLIRVFKEQKIHSLKMRAILTDKTQRERHKIDRNCTSPYYEGEFATLSKCFAVKIISDGNSNA